MCIPFTASFPGGSPGTTPNTHPLTSTCAHSVITKVSSSPTAKAKSFSYSVLDKLCNLLLLLFALVYFGATVCCVTSMSLHVNASVVHDMFLLLFQGTVLECGVNECLYSWPEMKNGVSKCAKLLEEKILFKG